MREWSETLEPQLTNRLHLRDIPASVGVFTLVDVRNHGGLEAYVRTLTDQLKTRNVKVYWNGAAPDEANDLAETWRPLVKRVLPAMTRTPVRFIARLVAECAGGASCRRDIANCDLVHFVGTGWDLVGFPLERAARRQRKVMTCWPAIHPGSWGDAPLDIDLYRRMDAVFAQSDCEMEYLAQRGVPREKLVRCGCAPSSEATGNSARFRRSFGLENKQIVLYVGRKSREKGYHALRSAVAQLTVTGRPVVLVSIGREVDPPYPTLPAETDINLGAADESTKQDAMAACDLFALPSAAESFGIVYVEAWSQSKPVICGAAPASRELVNRHSGGLCSDGSSEDIAATVAELLDSPLKSNQMGKRGNEAVKLHYTAEAVANVHLDVWQRVWGT